MAVYLWRGTANNYDWRTAANWSPNGVPGVVDTATFDGSSPKRCRVSGILLLRRLLMEEGFAGGVITFDGTIHLLSTEAEPSLLVAGQVKPLSPDCTIELYGVVRVGDGPVAFTGGAHKGRIFVGIEGVTSRIETVGQEDIECGSDLIIRYNGRWLNSCANLFLLNGASVFVNYGGFVYFRDRDGDPTDQRILGDASQADQAVFVDAGIVWVAYTVNVTLVLPLVVRNYGSVTVFSFSNDSFKLTGTLAVAGGNRASRKYSVWLAGGGVLQYVPETGQDTDVPADDVFSTEKGAFVDAGGLLWFNFTHFITEGKLVVAGTVVNVAGQWSCNGTVYLLSTAIFAGGTAEGGYFSKCRVFTGAAESARAFVIDPGAILQFTMGDPMPPTPPTTYTVIEASEITGTFNTFLFAGGLFEAGPEEGPLTYEVTYNGPLGGGG